MMDIHSNVWCNATDRPPCLRTQHLRNAICKVQRQKQRPTAARICKAVRQCVDNVSINQVTEWLNAAVQTGEILLINNDGVISYREPRRNLQSFSPSLRTTHPPPVLHQPECTWNFPPQYKPFQNFVPQPVNGAVVWTYPQRVACDPYMQFVDGTVAQHSGWLGSFAPVDHQLMFSNDSAQYQFNQRVSDQSLRQTSARYLQSACDDKRNQQNCSYGFLQAASDVIEVSLPSASNDATSAATSCCQMMDVDFGINSFCDEHSTAENTQMTSNASVLELPGIVVEQQETDGTDGLPCGTITEEQLDKVSTFYQEL